MSQIIRNVKIYFSFFIASIKSLIEYRADTMVGIISQLVTQSVELIFIWIVFQNTNALAGWNVNELILLYGVMMLALALVDLTMDNFYEIGHQYIKNGEFDQILLKPVHPIIYIMGSAKSITSIGYIIIGLIVITTALVQLQISITFFLILKILFFAFVGGGIIAGILLAFSTVSFWVYRANEIIWSAYKMSTLAQYPIKIYNTAIKIVITCILPFSFVAYFPISNILNKDNTYLAYLSPVVMILVWVIAIKIWNWGLKHYSSTGN